MLGYQKQPCFLRGGKIAELEKKAAEYAAKVIRHKMAIHDSFSKETTEKELIAAYIAGAKENGIVWHDLRKDQNDLPMHDCETVVIHENGNKNIIRWKNGNWTNAIIVPAVAWMEILQFTGE